MQNVDTTTNYLLDDFINAGKNNSFTLENTSMYHQVDDLQLPTSNLFYDKYRGLILSNCIKVTIPDDKITRYRFQPKTLSYDLYGTTDLWHILLWINNMTSVTDFIEKNIYIFNPNNISVLARIINNESSLLLENKENIPVINTAAKNITRR